LGFIVSKVFLQIDQVSFLLAFVAEKGVPFLLAEVKMETCILAKRTFAQNDFAALPSVYKPFLPNKV